ncbi:type II toxin-antitoxin system HicA family toxin [Nostoc sp. FACHB-888]|uniref:type II toxin-antitoxin system HicA family toxin n=1 Tax=Nostoc sp. FACHB-888 TaxID=2692842 RepID=UPI0016872A02|nr:type II toxin-antitoxin system HicA family toxin [Nostoc sp. FACHB-888]MBD2247260.1 type II toxin-antitoxin system HicA family toxin [Nostoc sp. FACHB-888]
MNNKQAATLKEIFATPVPSDLKWRDIESLLRSKGAVITEGKGSRVRVMLNGIKAIFHEPHPTGKNICKCTVEDVRLFLENAGISPE